MSEPEVSLKSFYFSLFDDGLAFKLWNWRLSVFAFKLFKLDLIVIRNYRTLQSPLYNMCKPIRHVDTFEYDLWCDANLYYRSKFLNYKISLEMQFPENLLFPL